MKIYSVYINEKENFPLNYLIQRISETYKIKITNKKDEANILFIRLKQKFDIFQLKNFKKLKYLCTATTGLTHIDQNYLKNFDIELISLAGESTFLKDIRTTADLALSMILSAQTLMINSSNAVFDGSFNRNNFFRNGFKNTHIGILGLGRLGTLVAEYLYQLGFKVFFFDIKEVKYDNKMITKCDSLEELFRSCRIISLHIDFNENNRGLVNRKLLFINPPYKIVNTSRAEIFESSEIDFCINKNILDQYLTDVLEEEPFDLINTVEDSKLWNLQKKYGMKSILITPHVGGACWDSLKKCEVFLINKLFKILN